MFGKKMPPERLPYDEARVAAQMTAANSLRENLRA